MNATGDTQRAIVPSCTSSTRVDDRESVLIPSPLSSCRTGRRFAEGLGVRERARAESEAIVPQSAEVHASQCSRERARISNSVSALVPNDSASHSAKFRSFTLTIHVQAKLYSLSVARLPGEIQPERCSIKVLSLRSSSMRLRRSLSVTVSTRWLLDHTDQSRLDAVDEPHLRRTQSWPRPRRLRRRRR